MSPGWLVLIAQLLVCCVLLKEVVVDGIIRGQTLNTEIEAQRAENQQLQVRNARIAAQVQALRNRDLTLVEERARRDLGMIKDNETFIVFADSQRF